MKKRKNIPLHREVLDRLDAGPKKSARTVYLTNDYYLKLVEFCDRSGYKPSNVIDELISSFLEGLESDEGAA